MKTDTENCVNCGRILSSDDGGEDNCKRCIETFIAEQAEGEIGIGDGSIFYVDEDHCRHGVGKWPMPETVYNAVYRGKK